MAAAFATFDEPHAWVIRGLVEYGWRDAGGTDGRVPAGSFGGIDLSGFAASQGRDGILLRVPACADGRVHPEDDVYAFSAKLVTEDGPLKVVVRCPDCNYIQEFPYDPANPLHAAGYVHQALTGYVPQFVRWRFQGGELGVSQRQGLPEFRGEPCSPALAKFVAERLSRHGQGFDLGPSEGWWLGQAPQAATAPPLVGAQPASARSWQGPIAVAGRGGGDPMYARPAGGPATAAAGAAALVRIPGTALQVAVVATMALWTLALCGGMLSLVGSLLSHLPQLVLYVVVLVAILGGGALALLGAKQYRELRPGPLVWVSFAYAALVPVCCLVGLPLAAWAAVVWMKPEVKGVWSAA